MPNGNGKARAMAENIMQVYDIISFIVEIGQNAHKCLLDIFVIGLRLGTKLDKYSGAFPATTKSIDKTPVNYVYLAGIEKRMALCLASACPN
jgi:hypothetical protein